MRLLLATAGSRGDVEPFAALAKRAVSAGHEVRLVVPDHSGVDLCGLDVVSMGVDYTALIEQQGVSVAAALRSYRSIVRPLMRAVIIESARAAWDYQPDVLLAHPKILSAALVADALSIPYVQVEIVPVVTPTSAFPAAGTVNRDLGRFNALTFSLARGGEAMFRSDLRDVSSMIGGPRRKPAPPAATLMPISPTLLDRPRDWNETVHLTGPWRMGGSGTVSAEVSEFITGGDFVYAGFGSMAAGDPVARAREVLSGIRAHGARALIATGLGGLEVPSQLRGEDVLVTGSVAHDAVLPHARAAVHHGGIGTLHAATAAGVVSVVVPFIADQPFWGARVCEKGLAPAPVRQRRLSSPRLRAALSETGQFQPAVQAAARAMASEDGAGTALQVLETLR